ncbi:MAG: fatty acid desaturase [Verrucomicrobia bacterium]|nr:fatty acid desaturase [Verrucomicrobiota bacterium]
MTFPVAGHRQGKDLILATVPFASELPGRSWLAVSSTLVLLVLAWVGALMLPNLGMKLLAGVLLGLLALRMFVIYHDHQHHSILPNSPLAGALMTVFGVWALSPPSIWRSSHNHHHNHNSQLLGSHIGSFPIMTADGYRKSSRYARVRYLAMRHPLTLLFGYVSIFLMGMCLGPFVRQPRRHSDCLISFLVHVAMGVGLHAYGGWTAVLCVQTLPSFLLYGVGSYLFYAQHNFPDVKFRSRGGWTYELAALESSSFLRMSAWMNWFTANIGYHHVHHLNSKIPFYRLPEAMRGIPELQNPRTTTFHPRDILACLRLKVWDTTAEVMTGCPRS